MCVVAQEERAGLGLGEDEPLDPYALADEHGIPVYALTSLREYDLRQEALDHYSGAGSDAWSAALVPVGTARMIVENDAHFLPRRRANISHELGHHLLEHSIEGIVLGEDHKRQFNVEQEKQALFISGQLLIPDRAARKAAYDGWNDDRVAAKFGVSSTFARMRMAGARVIASRAAAKRIL